MKRRPYDRVARYGVEPPPMFDEIAPQTPPAWTPKRSEPPRYSGSFEVCGLSIDDITPEVQQRLFERVGERLARWTATESSDGRTADGTTAFITWVIDWEVWEWEHHS